MSIDFHGFSMGFPSISIGFKGLPHLAPQLPSSMLQASLHQALQLRMAGLQLLQALFFGPLLVNPCESNQVCFSASPISILSIYIIYIYIYVSLLSVYRTLIC